MQTLGPFKIVILGEGRVGKTSLLKRYRYNKFDEHEASSQNATYLEKTVEDKKSGKEVKLALWDTAGQERFHSLAPIYYRDADGALIVYDITEPETFKRVATWVSELKVNGCNIPVSIVGNKYDMKTQQRVSAGEAEEFARQIGATHTFASAKHNRGVEETFAALIEGVVDHKSQAPAASARGRRSRPNISEQAPAAPAPRTSLGSRPAAVAAAAAQPAAQPQPSQPAQAAQAAQPAPKTSLGGQQPAPAAKPRKSLFDDDDDDEPAGKPAPAAPATAAAAAAAAFPPSVPPQGSSYSAPSPAPAAPPLAAPAAPREKGFKLHATPPATRGAVAGGSFASQQNGARKKEGCC